MALLRRAVYLLTAIECLLACSAAAQTTTGPESQCSASFPPAGSLLPSENLSEITPEPREGIQVIAPGLKFNCSGRIKEWSALLTIASTSSAVLRHELTLQVWRPDSSFDGEKFNLIGSNTLKLVPMDISTVGNLTFSLLERRLISEEERINFQPNDVIGWYSKERLAVNSGFGVAVQKNGLSSNLVSVLTSEVPCEVYTCADTVQSNSSALPLITCTVEYETSNSSSASSPTNSTCVPQSIPSSCSPTTTQTPQTTLPTPVTSTPPTAVTNTDMTLYIIAGVVPGGLLIMIFVVIGVLLMVLKFKEDRKWCSCVGKIVKSEHTNPTYDTYANPEDFIRLNEPLTKVPPQNGLFYITGDSSLPPTPIGFSEDSTRLPSDDTCDGHNYATTYQANGENHIYHELVKNPEPPPLPHRSSCMSLKGTGSLRGTGSLKGRQSAPRFSVQSITQFPYTLPNTPAPSYPYLEAIPTAQSPARPLTPQESPPSSASTVSEKELTVRKLFHALDEEGFRVPTAEERAMYSESHVDEIYSKLHRPHSYTKNRDSRDDTFFEPSEIYWEPSHSSAELFNQLAKRKYREIKRSNIRIFETLGGGHFSTVHKGIWDVPGGCVEVAVKTLKPKSSETDRVKFLQEAAIMGQFLHPNVIKLQGVVTIGEPVMIVLEVMPKGDLKNFLRSLRSQPKSPDLPNMFLRFCREVAFGMNYLSNKGYVHRDLAARNILLTEDLTCKIADFGMARDLDVDTIYQSQGGKIPLKWTAPEGLRHRQYSSASDVWSYGMLLFEIWTLGRKPFEGASTDELMELMEKFHCQPPPPGTPREIYRLMVQCWHPVPTERPRFSEVCTFLNSTDEVLLNWSNADKALGSRVAELGAPLSEGVNLYLDLQNMYCISQERRGSNVSITAV